MGMGKSQSADCAKRCLHSMCTGTTESSSLEDYCNMHQELQEHLQTTFPNCSDLSTISDRGFTPHLSLGQFRRHEVESFVAFRRHEVESFVAKSRQDWTEIVFQVTDVALISRSGRGDPFVVRTTVPLAKSL